MTPDASSAIAADDEARILATGFKEVGATFALATARRSALSVGLTFTTSFVLSQWRPDIGIIAFVFGPLLVVHLLWFWAMFARGVAVGAARALPLWERHRLDLILKRVDTHLTMKRATP